MNIASIAAVCSSKSDTVSMFLKKITDYIVKIIHYIYYNKYQKGLLLISAILMWNANQDNSYNSI